MLNMDAKEPSNYLILFSTGALIIVSTLFVFFRLRKESTEGNDEPLTLELDSSGWDEISSTPPPPVPPLRKKDTPKEPKNKKSKTKSIVTSTPCSQKKTSLENDEKPFNSSYYYAHNHLKKTGGYKDGLKAEDYQMNKPKLLSKSSTELNGIDSSKPTFRNGKWIRISRYLWDDHESYDGVARIIIEAIPSDGTSSFTMIPFVHAGINKEDVKCKLVGTWNNGLMVQIRRILGDEESKYFLFIPRMYGEVEDVKPIVKAKKIIIKLIKKRNSDNLKVWPQLPSDLKIPAGTTNEFEDLFDTDNN